MAINVSGSKTLTKLSLGSSLTVDISHNYNLFQVYDPNTNAFAPDWSATDTPLNLKAIIYYNGKDVTSEAIYEWTSCYDSSSEVSSAGTNKELTINTNVLQGHTSITYTVKATYNKLTATNDITFTLINAGKQGNPGTNGVDAYYADIYSTDTVFSTSVTTLTFKANLYKGATTLIPSSYTWKINGEEITSTSTEDNAYLNNNDLIVKSAYISFSATATCAVTTTVDEKTISRIASVQITDKTDVENLEERVSIVVDKDKKLNLNFDFNSDTSSSLSTSGIQLVGDQGVFRVDSTQLGFFAKQEDGTIGELLLGFGKKNGSNISDKLYVKGEVEAEKFVATTTTNDGTLLTFGVDGGTMSFSKKVENAETEDLLIYKEGNLILAGDILIGSSYSINDSIIRALSFLSLKGDINTSGLTTRKVSSGVAILVK